MSHAAELSNFRLQLFSLEELLWEGRVTQVFLPGSDGVVCFLPGHTPLTLTLGKGNCVIHPIYKNENIKTIPLEGGFAEMLEDQCRVFCEIKNISK